LRWLTCQNRIERSFKVYGHKHNVFSIQILLHYIGSRMSQHLYF
jgi:hypothetical protein